jgi:Protein of unknown function (DUF3175)
VSGTACRKQNSREGHFADAEATDFEEMVAKGDRNQRRSRPASEHSHRRKSSPFRSAMSMLTFYISRAGTNLPTSRKRVLEAAKTELRRLFRRPPRI